MLWSPTEQTDSERAIFVADLRQRTVNVPGVWCRVRFIFNVPLEIAGLGWLI